MIYFQLQCWLSNYNEGSLEFGCALLSLSKYPQGRYKSKMNKEENDILILTLLLINKGEPLNNSYRIMRILEWNFRFIETNKILDEVKNKYAQYELLNGVHYYKLTVEGKELIKEKYDTALSSLLISYPQESDAITSLFNSFSINADF